MNLEPRSFSKSQQSHLDGFLTEHMAEYQVIYLPTYRRIEKDLSLIFPDLEESIQTFQRRKGLLPNQSRQGHVELVEFGMEDVESTFNRIRSEMIETARAELNNLAGGGGLP
jgi:hypothetical protein